MRETLVSAIFASRIALNKQNSGCKCGLLGAAMFYPESPMTKRNSAKPLSSNKHLLRWVEKMVELCQPDAIHWIDGSQEEYNALCAQMVAGGTFIKLNQKKWPGCYLARSDPGDVARVEDRTFICALSQEAAGPTNN